MLGEEKFISSKKGRKEEKAGDSAERIRKISRPLAGCRWPHAHEKDRVWCMYEIGWCKSGADSRDGKGQTHERIQSWKCVSITSHRCVVVVVSRGWEEGRLHSRGGEKKRAVFRGWRRDNWAQRECILTPADAIIRPLVCISLLRKEVQLRSYFSFSFSFSSIYHGLFNSPYASLISQCG